MDNFEDYKNLYLNSNELKIENSKIRYNEIRKKYLNLAEEARIKFECFYIENYSNIDDVIENSKQKAKETINSYFDDTFFSLLKDITTDDKKEEFIENYKKKGYYTFDDEFAKVNSKYIQIEQNKIKKDMEIDEKYSREEEDEKEQNIQNKLYSLAKNAINSTMTAIDKTGSSFDQLSEKKALFENKNTMFVLSRGVFDSVLNIHLEAVSYLIENEKEDIKIYTDEDIKTAKNIFNNAKFRNRGFEDFSLYLLNAIEKYPYCEEFYRYTIRNYKDEKNEIEKIATIFNVPVHEYKIDIFTDTLGDLPVDDEKNAISSKEKIEKTAALLGLEIDEIRKINQIEIVYKAVYDFDINYRTVEDILFEDRKEAELARWESSKIKEILKDIDYESETSLKEKKDEIEKNEFQTKIKDRYLEDLKARIIKKDIEYRTVNDKEFPTRQMADLARKEKKLIEDVIDEAGSLNQKNIEEAITKINLMDLKCNLEDDYLLKLDSKLKNIKKLNQTAANISNTAKAIGKKIGDMFK